MTRSTMAMSVRIMNQGRLRLCAIARSNSSAIDTWLNARKLGVRLRVFDVESGLPLQRAAARRHPWLSPQPVHALPYVSRLAGPAGAGARSRYRWRMPWHRLQGEE